MNTCKTSHLIHLALATVLITTAGALHAQDPRHDDHGHGNSAQNHGNDHQGAPDWHFGNDDRGRFQQHYQKDAQQWRGRRNRPHFDRGAVIPRNYAIRTVPSSYYRGAPPPPSGYRYGYYDGYVVTYNPVTRIIADVLDLATQ